MGLNRFMKDHETQVNLSVVKHKRLQQACFLWINIHIVYDCVLYCRSNSLYQPVIHVQKTYAKLSQKTTIICLSIQNQYSKTA